MVRSARARDASDGDLTRRLSRPGRGLRRADRRAPARSARTGSRFCTRSPTLDPATRAQRIEQLNTRVRETGIAHDLFADPASTAQPWRVDLVPADRGARGMARAGARPHPARAAVRGAFSPTSTGRSGCWHRAPFRISWCSATPPSCGPASICEPAGGYIQFFATDLARGPDGRWRVIDTHTETPAGIGYALANRMVHTNVAGDIFGACHAHAAGAVLPAAAGRAGTPRQPRRSDHRAADAGPAPQRLLQPRLSRPLSRPAAGRGRRSARDRRPRLARRRWKA